MKNYSEVMDLIRIRDAWEAASREDLRRRLPAILFETLSLKV